MNRFGDGPAVGGIARVGGGEGMVARGESKNEGGLALLVERCAGQFADLAAAVVADGNGAGSG